MFNFNLMNRALKDAELKDAFRMLYYIVNKCSLKNSMSVEIFDAEFELALSISPRSTCRFTKKLEERGYIKKEVRGTSQNKLANIYTLIDIDATEDNNVPLTDNANIDGSSDGRIGILKNNNKINKNNKLFLSNTTGIYTGINIITGYNKNKFIKHDVNNINTGNSDVEIKDLRIEENINLNNENVMNEERMNEMNNINNSNKNNLNTSNKNNLNTSTLEEILENQALDDQQVFNTTGKYMNIENNYPKEEQDRYQRLFNKCKSQIEIWVKTHDYSCISMFDSFFKAIQYMYHEKTISDNQWNAAQRCLFQRFKNLRNGYNNYIQNKNKTISSNEVNGCNNPQPPRQQNDQIEEAV